VGKLSVSLSLCNGHPLQNATILTNLPAVEKWRDPRKAKNNQNQNNNNPYYGNQWGLEWKRVSLIWKKVSENIIKTNTI